jgi:hypothetical protein
VNWARTLPGPAPREPAGVSIHGTLAVGDGRDPVAEALALVFQSNAALAGGDD